MIGPDTAYYERVRDWSSSERYRVEMRALIERLELKAGARVLDIGCATGAATRLLRQAGVRAIGLEAGEAWVALCPERWMVRADAASLPFAAATFAAAVLMHSLAHLRDPLAALREAGRVVVAGGPIGIATPNEEYVKALRRRGGKGYVPDPTVEDHFGLRSLRRLLRQAGLEPVVAEGWEAMPGAMPVRGAPERLFAIARRSPAVFASHTTSVESLTRRDDGRARA